MPTPVAQNPNPLAMRGAIIGAPVSASQTMHHLNTLSFLLGRATEAVASAMFPSGGGPTYNLNYWRSPGCQVLGVDVELWSDPTNETALRLSASLPGATMLPGGSQMNGSDLFFTFPAVSHRRTYRCFFDVTGLSTSAPQYVQIKWTNQSGNLGVRRITLTEIPLVSLDPVGDVTNEVGVDAGWPAAGNDMMEGGSASPRGWYRVVDQLDKARTKVRRHIQFCGADSTVFGSGVFHTSSATYVNMLPNGSGTVRTRARRLRANYTGALTVPNTYLVQTRYLAAGGAALRLAVTPVGFPGSTVNWDYVLPISGVFTATTPASISLPCFGTNQEVDITPMILSASGQAYVGNVALMESEA